MEVRARDKRDSSWRGMGRGIGIPTLRGEETGSMDCPWWEQDMENREPFMEGNGQGNRNPPLRGQGLGERDYPPESGDRDPP